MGVAKILTVQPIQLNRNCAINTGSSIRLAINAVIIASPHKTPK
jgi:hypothetical protein